MKHFFLFTVILLGSGTIPLSAQGVWSHPSFVNGGARFDDMSFIHPDTGWVVSGGGKIFRTNDGAASWALQYENDFYFRSVEFVDAQLGFAGTLDAAFLKTEDGGQSWENIMEELPIQPSGICGSQWLGDSIFLAVGSWFGPAFVLRTNDRGSSWEAWDLNEYAFGLIDVHFVSADTGFVCGRGYDGGVILHTTDGGMSWEEVYNTNNAGDYVWKLQFIDELNVVASVQTFGSSSWMPISNDGGLSWIQKTVPYGDAQGIGFVTPQHGWIGGYSSGFWETHNAGDDWQYINFGGNYNRFVVFDSTLAYAAGYSVFKYEDTTTVIANVATPLSREFDPQLTVTPNPMAGFGQVKFSLPALNNVDLNLYSYEGKLLKPIFTGRLSKGDYQYDIPPNLPPGKYLLGLQVNEGIFSVPVVVRE
jgi:photosystem II stability/assembly factor-like uncharacterized protein